MLPTRPVAKITFSGRSTSPSTSSHLDARRRCAPRVARPTPVQHAHAHVAEGRGEEVGDLVVHERQQARAAVDEDDLGARAR